LFGYPSTPFDRRFFAAAIDYLQRSLIDRFFSSISQNQTARKVSLKRLRRADACDVFFYFLPLSRLFTAFTSLENFRFPGPTT